jgi:hypothetical protein
MLQKPLALLLIGIFSCFLGAQVTIQPKPSEAEAKLAKDAVELLRETSSEVGRLRTMENRISFNAEIASLMWFHDEKEAKSMYGGVVSDFKQLLSQLDAQMNSPVDPDDDISGSVGGAFFGGYGKSKAERKLRVAMEVRKQIASSLAEHAPDLAFNFFYDSLTLISNPEFRKSQQESDKYFEFQLIQMIAMSDAAKALEYGKESLKSGPVDNKHIELLEKLYAKDADKAADYGAALLSRLKTDRSAANVYVYAGLISFGGRTLEDSKTPGGKRAVYEAGDLRDLAELFADTILESNGEDARYAGLQYVGMIEKYSPSRAAQIKAKFRKQLSAVNAPPAYVTEMATVSANSNTSVYTGGSSSANSAQQHAIAVRVAREATEKKLIGDIKDLGSKPLPKEERDKIVAQSRKIIAETPGKDKRATALTLLATQVAHAGDKELASEIMRDAERFVNPQPKNYQDFMMSWVLASGYAETDPDKAFPLLESTILRANDTISAFIKVGEFIDLQNEMVDDGEVQVGMFGGSMIRGFTNELGLATNTVRALAIADFQKTVNLTNTFDRTETRVLAKMLVLRSVLDTRPKTVADDGIGG